MAANPDCFVSILKIYLTKRNHLQSKTKVACMHEFIKISEWIGGFCPKSVMASNLHTKCVNFHQNHIFHSCNTCIFALVQVNLCRKLFILQNMGRTCCVQKLFWMSETFSVHNMFSPGLSLDFSCIKLVIQWTICRHIVG